MFDSNKIIEKKRIKKRKTENKTPNNDVTRTLRGNVPLMNNECPKFAEHNRKWPKCGIPGISIGISF